MFECFMQEILHEVEMDILSWLMAIIYVEAITEIIVDSSLLFNIRDKLCTKYPGKIAELLTCGYCMSVWIAAPIAIFMPYQITSIRLLDYFMKIFILHRLSNIFHHLTKWTIKLGICRGETDEQTI